MEAPLPVEKPRDCLICFGPIRRNAPFWVQGTPVACDCRPQLHRTCWEAWAAQAGPVCVICRSQKYPPAPPHQHVVRPPHDGPILFGRPIDRSTAILILFIVFYAAIFLLSYLEPSGRPTYRPLYNRHTEL
jgi:hypothetical protein